MEIRRPTPAESPVVGEQLLAPSYRAAERRDPEFSALTDDATTDVDCSPWLDDEDADVFVAVDWEIEGENGTGDDRDRDDWDGNGSDAGDGDHLVGVVTVRAGDSPPIYDRGRVASVTGVYVREGYRQRGVATELIERAHEWAADRGCAYLNGFVHADNDPSLALFEREFEEKFRQFYRPVDP